MFRLHRVTVVQGKLASWALPSGHHHPGTQRPQPLQAARRLVTFTSPMKPPFTVGWDLSPAAVLAPQVLGFLTAAAAGSSALVSPAAVDSQADQQWAGWAWGQATTRAVMLLLHVGAPAWPSVACCFPLSPVAGLHSRLFRLHTCTVCGYPLGTPMRSCSQACLASFIACHVPHPTGEGLLTSFLLTNALLIPSLTHKHLLTFSNSILLPVTYRNTHTHRACFLHKQCTQKPEDNCKVMYDILNLHSVLHFCLFCGLYLYYLLFTGKPLLHSQTSTMY